MEGNLTILKDKIKELAVEILNIERERIGIREDMSDLKKELNCVAPKNYINKLIKVYLGKGRLHDEEVMEYRQVCNLLGIPYTCEVIQPEDIEDDDPNVKARKDRIVSILSRYKNLVDENNQLVVEVRGLYARAKNSGISVPLLKKLVDFVLHPDKLRAYHEDTPLLQAYTEVIPDIE